MLNDKCLRCGESDSSKSHTLASVGSTPTPATTFHGAYNMDHGIFQNPMIHDKCKMINVPCPTSAASAETGLQTRSWRGQHLPDVPRFIHREEESNPPDLGPGDTRGSTEAMDQFHLSFGI